MITLTDFLLARIAEDEAVARSAKPGPWYLECSHGAPDNQIHHVMGVLRDKYGDNPVSTDDHETVDHISRHDPARVLAECEAKRRTVESYVEEYGHGNWLVDHDVLRLFALPYADHPDYREEWRP